MKRSYISKAISTLAQDIRELIGLRRIRNDWGDPAIITNATRMILICMHSIFLRKVMDLITHKSFQTLDSPEIQEKLRILYQEAVEEYYHQNIGSSNVTFSEFWDMLIADRRIDINVPDQYFHAKLQTCVLWQAMHVLFYPGKANNTSIYSVGPDSFETDEDIPDQVSTCPLLELAIKQMISTEYMPIDPSWKESSEYLQDHPYFRTQINPNVCVPFVGVRSSTSKTLGDVWNDYTAKEHLSEASLTKAVMSYHCESFLDRYFAELTDSYIAAIEVLGGAVDFYGDTWEEDAESQEEIKRLRSLNYSLQDSVIRLSTKSPVEDLSSKKYGSLWERVACEGDLMKEIPGEDGIYSIKVRGAKSFQEQLMTFLENECKEKGISDYYAHLPTDKELTEKVRKKNGKPYGKKTFHDTRNAP